MLYRVAQKSAEFTLERKIKGFFHVNPTREEKIIQILRTFFKIKGKKSDK